MSNRRQARERRAAVMLPEDALITEARQFRRSRISSANIRS